MAVITRSQSKKAPGFTSVTSKTHSPSSSNTAPERTKSRPVKRRNINMTSEQAQTETKTEPQPQPHPHPHPQMEVLGDDMGPSASQESSHPPPPANAEEEKRWNDEIFDDHNTKWVGTIVNSHFGTLEKRIYSYINAAFPYASECRWDSLSSEIKSELRQLTSKAELYLGNTLFDVANHLYQAWIYQLLFDNLFSADCADKWAGKEWIAFGNLDKILRADVTNEDNPPNIAHHMAKKLLMRTLYMHHGYHSDAKRLKQIILDATTPLTQLFDPLKREREPGSGPPDPEKELDEVVEHAIRVDMYMAVNRNRFVVTMSGPTAGSKTGFGFDRSWMRVIPGGIDSKHKNINGRPVDLIMEPLIQMYGERGPPPFHDDESSEILVQTTERAWHMYHKRGYLRRMRVMVDQFPGEEIRAKRSWEIDDYGDSGSDSMDFDEHADEENMRLLKFTMALDAYREKEKANQKHEGGSGAQ